MTKLKKDEELKNNISNLADEIKTYIEKENKQQAKTLLKNPKNPSIAIAYNIFADILGGVITAFILNSIYCKFFAKNNLVFALLLIFCIMAGLYGAIKSVMKIGKTNDKNNTSC